MLEKQLKKYNITKAEFARYIGYSGEGLRRALKTKPKGAPLLENTFFIMLLERKGIDLDMIKNFVDVLYDKK